MKISRYEQLLQDPRWHERRERFIAALGDDMVKCSHCGSESHLQLHHKVYHKGKMPWEYEHEDLVLLCDDCHEEIHETARKIERMIIGWAPSEILELRSMVEAAHKSKHKHAISLAKNYIRDYLTEYPSYGVHNIAPGLCPELDAMVKAIAEKWTTHRT